MELITNVLIPTILTLAELPVTAKNWALDKALNAMAVGLINRERKPELFAILASQATLELTRRDMQDDHVAQQRVMLACLNSSRRLTGDDCVPEIVQGLFDKIFTWITANADGQPEGWARIATLWVYHALTFLEKNEYDTELLEKAREVNDLVERAGVASPYDVTINRFRFVLLELHDAIVQGADADTLADLQHQLEDAGQSACDTMDDAGQHELHGVPSDGLLHWQRVNIPAHIMLGWLFSQPLVHLPPKENTLEWIHRITELPFEEDATAHWVQLGTAVIHWIRNQLEDAAPAAQSVISNEKPLPLANIGAARLILARCMWHNDVKDGARDHCTLVIHDDGPGGRAVRAAAGSLLAKFEATA